MGLECSHNAFYGAYPAFNRLRQFMAKAIGGSYPPHEDKSLDNDLWYFENTTHSTKTHPGLTAFFNHADDSGEIEPEMCKIIAEELENEMESFIRLAETYPATGHILCQGGHVKVIQKFIKGLRTAYKTNEVLRFD